MNRHERRRARAISAVTERTITREEADAMPHVCCWGECEMTFKNPMPKGWRNLLLFWNANPVLDLRQVPDETWDRDGTLCPKHAAELDALLKNNGRGLAGAAPLGSA